MRNVMQNVSFPISQISNRDAHVRQFYLHTWNYFPVFGQCRGSIAEQSRAAADLSADQWEMMSREQHIL